MAINYENVDKVINLFFSFLPHGSNYSDAVYGMKFEQKEYFEIQKYLLDNDILEVWGAHGKHIISKKGISIVETHGGIEKFLEFEKNQQKEIVRLEKIKNQKLYFDAKISKWKYYTFWPLFFVAIFGGGYSAFDLIERLTKSKPNQSIQNPRVETESELSKSHTLVLDQKNPDSLHSSKTPSDSLTTN